MLNGIRNFVKGFQTIAGVAKDFSMSQFSRMWASGDEWMASGDSVQGPSRPYAQSLWVFRCVSEIQKTCKSIPLQFARKSGEIKYNSKSYRLEIKKSWSSAAPLNHATQQKTTIKPVGGCKSVCVGKLADDEIIETGEAVEFFSRPNSYQDWPAFIEAHLGWLNLTGSVAWIMTDFTGNRPGAMHIVNGKRVAPVFLEQPDAHKQLVGYKYTPAGSGREINLAPDEVKYFVLWSDDDSPLASMSPLQPGRLATASDYQASMYNASMFANGCEPGLTITVPGTLDANQRSAFETAIRKKYAGARNAKKPLVLEGGATAKDYQTSMADMQFDAGKKNWRLEICALYGVPPVVAGWVDAAGDSSAYTANALKQYYQQTIFPSLDTITPAIQEITSRFDTSLAVWWNVENQPVVQQMRLANLDAAKKLFDMGRPWVDINDWLDLGMPSREWDEVGFLTANLLRASDVAEGTDIAVINEPTGDDRGVKNQEKNQPRSEDRTLNNLWKAWEKSWAPIARSFAASLRTRIVKQQRAVLARLAKEKDKLQKTNLKQTQISKTENLKITKDIIARLLVDIQPGRDKNFIATVKRFIDATGTLGVRQALAEAGYAGEQLDVAAGKVLANPAITESLAKRSVLVATKIDAFTRKVLKNNLAAAIAEGQTPKQLATRIQEVLGNRRGAALGQARNAIGQTLSDSRHNGQKAAGMQFKYWLSSRGPGDRRPAHIAAEVHYRKQPVAIDMPFVINGIALMYPRDFSAGHPQETVNCQCLHIATRSDKPKDFEAAVKKMIGIYHASTERSGR